MALPQKIQINAITGSSSPDLIDNDLNAGIKQPLVDILGIPDNTNVAAAGLNFVAAGLDRVIFQDAAGDPSAAGRLQRNAADLLFHDGTAARTFVNTATAQSLALKTLVAPVLSGSVTGTYTLAGTPTVTAPTISSPVLSGSVTGTYTLAGTPTITAPTISSPVLSGTATGTYTLAGTPTVTAPTISAPTFSGTAAGSLTNLALTTPTLTTATLAGTTTVSGGQLAFPATQSASSNANTLDDYEEGTWQPTLTFTTVGDLNVVYSTRTGTYQKIGKKVTIWFTIVTSTFTHTTANLGLKITGIPVDSAASISVGSLAFSGITKASYTQYVVDSGNADHLIVRASGSGQAGGFVSAADMPTGGTVSLFGSVSYLADA